MDNECLESLKPCPSCKGQHVSVLPAGKQFYVECQADIDCFTFGPLGNTKDRAIKLWEQRSETGCFFCGSRIRKGFSDPVLTDLICHDCGAEWDLE